MIRTKIVCTLGPATSEPSVIRELILAGMDVARVNLSHGDAASNRGLIRTVRRMARGLDRTVSILADLQGPKIRVGRLPPEGLDLRTGTAIRLVSASESRRPGEIPIPHPEILSSLRSGQRLLLDDGRLELEIREVNPEQTSAWVVVGGRLTSRKGINLPGAKLPIPALTPKDRTDLELVLAEEVDYVALSFVRRGQDVTELRELLGDSGADIGVIAKIEKPEALEEIEEILARSDGLMVARGDLGVETAAEDVPFHQKRLIQLANQAGKPVITATQMLQSMIESPRPTRAEASDVANAVLDGSDAVMLSGETAVGRHPLEAVRTMNRILESSQAHLACPCRPSSAGQDGPEPVEAAIGRATVQVAQAVGARAIVASTVSGVTARMVARHRPGLPIIGATPREKTLRRLPLIWGVHPVRLESYRTTDEMLRLAARAARASGLVRSGDRIVLASGIPPGGAGTTNSCQVLELSEEPGS